MSREPSDHSSGACREARHHGRLTAGRPRRRHGHFRGGPIVGCRDRLRSRQAGSLRTHPKREPRRLSDSCAARSRSRGNQKEVLSDGMSPTKEIHTRSGAWTRPSASFRSTRRTRSRGAPHAGRRLCWLTSPVYWVRQLAAGVGWFLATNGRRIAMLIGATARRPGRDGKA